MSIEFEARIQRRKKYDYHKDKKYIYEQTFLIVPKDIAKKLKKGKIVRVNIN